MEEEDVSKDVKQGCTESDILYLRRDELCRYGIQTYFSQCLTQTQPDDEDLDEGVDEDFEVRIQ